MAGWRGVDVGTGRRRRGRFWRITKQSMADKLVEHTNYINKLGQDLPEIRDWIWAGQKDT